MGLGGRPQLQGWGYWAEDGEGGGREAMGKEMGRLAWGKRSLG